jgi:hypothetical protein
MTHSFAHGRDATIVAVTSEPDGSARGIAVDRLERGVIATRTIGFGALAATVTALAHAGIVGLGF